MTQMTYGNGNSISYEYDEFDRMTKMRYNDTGNYVTYIYNAENSLAELTYLDDNDNVVSVYTFEYDSLGRLIRSEEFDGTGTVVQRIEQIYDSIGRLSSQSWVVGEDSYTESYHYNDPTPGGEDSEGDGSLQKVATATGDTIHYSYDGLKRISDATVRDTGGELRYQTSYAYKKIDSTETSAVEGNETGLVEVYKIHGADNSLVDGYKYTYDELGNITGIYEGELIGDNTEHRPLALYSYDTQNQLTAETLYTYADTNTTTSPTSSRFYTYTYDTAGNLLTRTHCARNGGLVSTKNYTYGNSSWQDLLTEYDGELLAYEGQTYQVQTNSLTGAVAISVTGSPISGNPIHYYNGMHYDMEWEQGRNLVENSFEWEDHSSSDQLQWIETENDLGYTYDSDGIRTSKTVTAKTYRYKSSSGSAVASITSLTPFPPIEPLPEETYTRFLSATKTTVHNYVTQNGKVVRETIGTGSTAKVLDFIYDNAGNPFALKYTNGTAAPVTYYYVLNYQGDVVLLLDENGAEVANYRYNAWGEILQAIGDMAEINPLRYRGYYYDAETGFYYLQSRYYDPRNCRFINADIYTSTGTGFLGYNMFVYCNNNCVSLVDPEGEDPWWMLDGDWGYIHRQVQDHIVTYTTHRRLTKEQKIEYTKGGTGKADIYDPNTNEIWEVKSSGPASLSASTQLDLYCSGTIPGTTIHPQKGREGFFGIFDTEEFRVVYWTNGRGVILYKFWRREKPEEAVYALLFAGALGLCLLRSRHRETAFDLREAVM